MNKEKILEPIEKRKSTRSFQEKQVEDDKIRLIFEAGRWAASSMNEQPWRFVYRNKYENEMSYNNLFETLSEGNKKWAGKAPLLIAAIAKKNFDYHNKPNRHYLYDTGQAVANMMIEIVHLGLAGHEMGGFHMEEARQKLGVPDEYEIAVLIAVGYPGRPEDLPEDLKEREEAPRQRKEIGEIVFKDNFRV